MTVNEVYNLLGAFANSLIEIESNWTKFEFNFKIQPKMFGISTRIYFVDGNYKSLRARPNNEVKDSVKWLHTITTMGGSNKWNKAIFRMFPDKNFEIDFIWDEVYQAEVDKYNQEAEQEDINYKRPKWHWEN